MATNDDQAPGGPAPIRIGDAERQRMTELLQRHMAAGRLDMPEYERRVEHATSAVYEQDLDGLLDDLPPIDEAGEPVRGRAGGTSDWSRERGSRDDTSWWPPFPTGRGGRGWPGRGFPFPVLALGVVALVVATHGWILFPLLFLFFFARGGGCGPRHHRSHGSRHEHGGAHDDDAWDRAGDGRPQWPGRFEPSRDDRRL